jgi:hypothetical protein
VSDPAPVGAAMWGNRPLPRQPDAPGPPATTPTQPPATAYPARVTVKDAVSIGLATIGDVLIVVGAGLAWGGPIAMIVGVVSVLALGLLIGVAG